MNISKDADIKRLDIYIKDNSTECTGTLILSISDDNISIDDKYGAALHMGDHIEIFGDDRIEEDK